ncbi:MAG: NAD-dependent epimerase/dehydratase family protein, partial [Gemmatimonadales bacterium]
AEDGHEVIAGCGPGGPAVGGVARAARAVPLDVTRRESVDEFLADGGEAVVHLAGVASVREANADPARAWAVNAEGTARIARRLVEIKRAGRADPLLLISSSGEVYVPCAGRPHVETDPVGPVAPYAASKLGAELAALEAWRSAGLRVVVARAFPHIGPGQHPSYWVARQVRVLLEAKRRRAPVVTVGDLTAVRDFSHVDDVVDAYVALLASGVPGEVYNVSSGEAVTLDLVLSKLEMLIGIHPLREVDAGEMRPDARPYHVGDAAKLRAATGWRPRRTLGDTLRDVLDARAD